MSIKTITVFILTWDADDTHHMQIEPDYGRAATICATLRKRWGVDRVHITIEEIEPEEAFPL